METMCNNGAGKDDQINEMSKKDEISRIMNILNNVDLTKNQIEKLREKHINLNYLKSAYRGTHNWTPQLRKKWERWQQNCDYHLLSEQDKASQFQQWKNRYWYKPYIILEFSQPVPMADYWYVYGKHKVTCITESKTIIDKRIKELNQCQYCGMAWCEHGKCREYKNTIFKWMRQFGVTFGQAKDKMGHFCLKCGAVGGHYDNKCIFDGNNRSCCACCGSYKHGTRKSDECSYWTGIAILTLYYNDYYLRNKKIGSKYITNTGDINKDWNLVDFEIKLDKIKNEKLLTRYRKILRQKELIKYLCLDGNFYGNDINKLDIVK